MESRLKPFDLMCTATLRPELLKRTFDSHIKCLFREHIKQARLIINIDMIGSKGYPDQDLNEIIQYINSIPFRDIVLNVQHKPSFSEAFWWCLGQLENGLTFNLEEDWEMKQWLDFEEMVSHFDDNELAHLRLSAFKSTGATTMKVWNKFILWNGDFFEVPRNLRGTIGWAGHPSLNKTAFLLFFRSIIDPAKNPEKQIKGHHPIILNSRFGVFHPKEKAPAIIQDIGRDWMEENGYQKKGTKAFFTEWERTPKIKNEKCPACGSTEMEIHSIMDETMYEGTDKYPWCECLLCKKRFAKYKGEGK